MTDVEAKEREKGYQVERMWSPAADKFMENNIFPLLREENPDCDIIGIYRYKHNGERDRNKYDHDTAMQVSGKDGYILLHNRKTGDLTHVYFQDKFSNIPIYEGKWGPSEFIEISDNGGWPGWACGLEDVRFLFFYHPDKIHYLDGVDRFVHLCNKIYNRWDEGGRKYQEMIVNLPSDPVLNIPSISSQKLIVDTKDGRGKTKIKTNMTRFIFERISKYKYLSFGLEKYK